MFHLTERVLILINMEKELNHTLQAGSEKIENEPRLTSVVDVLSGMFSGNSPLAKGFRNWKAKQNKGKEVSHGE